MPRVFSETLLQIISRHHPGAHRFLLSCRLRHAGLADVTNEGCGQLDAVRGRVRAPNGLEQHKEAIVDDGEEEALGISRA